MKDRTVILAIALIAVLVLFGPEIRAALSKIEMPAPNITIQQVQSVDLLNEVVITNQQLPTPAPAQVLEPVITGVPVIPADVRQLTSEQTDACQAAKDAGRRSPNYCRATPQPEVGYGR